jgi:hypothetical protein
VGTALAWQIAFLFIAKGPSRHRPLMIPSVFEKFAHGTVVVILVAQGRMHPSDIVFGGIDLLLGILFVIAYFKTPRRAT